MRDIDLFGQALGLAEPWRVERADFDAEAKRLELYVDFARGARFTCPECGWGGCPAYDTTEKRWRHLNFFQHEAFLNARVPRVECQACGVKQVDVPWARQSSGFTLLFEAMVMSMVPHMTVAAVARLIGETDHRIWRILHHYVEHAREQADFSAVRHLGVDETASRRGHEYVSLFVDLEGPRLLFGTEGKDANTFGAFRLDLMKHGGDPERITDVAMDMSAAFQRGARIHLPGAQVTFDRFHVVKLFNEAIEEVRRAERKERDELKRTRWLWLKNPENLTKRQAEELATLLTPRTEGLQTAEAYQMKLSFLEEFWSLPPALAEAFLKKWCRWAKDTALTPMHRLANTLWKHRAGLLRWYFSEISNGILEAINSLVQAAKARARGYRTTRNFLTMAYLLAGKLEFELPT